MKQRILKKRSKSAYDYGIEYNILNVKNLFKAQNQENYTDIAIDCSCTSDFCRHDTHPLKGTWMIGGLEGYYEPEWEERTLFEWMREYILFSGDMKQMPKDEKEKLMRCLGITQKGVDSNIKWMMEGIESLDEL